MYHSILIHILSLPIIHWMYGGLLNCFPVGAGAVFGTSSMERCRPVPKVMDHGERFVMPHPDHLRRQMWRPSEGHMSRAMIDMKRFFTSMKSEPAIRVTSSVRRQVSLAQG
ncbi:hypothetical protein DAEQUDRAFT_339314 [Daedalea quercina L-15889]|uniref:Uncharacterized protein n=1 Tax=Daedalea quercina L-15889 TaxID=1314783 RepID=A0A165PKM5_9APHY|nr:hypothetical protein DAEQUDRAFT_339314 [Daedalea quercina L-15889]